MLTNCLHTVPSPPSCCDRAVPEGGCFVLKQANNFLIQPGALQSRPGELSAKHYHQIKYRTFPLAREASKIQAGTKVTLSPARQDKTRVSRFGLNVLLCLPLCPLLEGQKRSLPGTIDYVGLPGCHFTLGLTRYLAANFLFLTHCRLALYTEQKRGQLHNLKSLQSKSQ